MVRIMAFADWNKCNGGEWKSFLESRQIEAVQVDRCRDKRNASDIALGINAAHIAASTDIRDFFVVSNDSDFLYLVDFLQKKGCRVFGVGYSRVSRRLRERFEAFFDSTEHISSSASSIGEFQEDNMLCQEIQKLELMFVESYMYLAKGSRDWISMSIFASEFKKRYPNYITPSGISNKVSRAILRFPGKFEFKIKGNMTYIRVSPADWRDLNCQTATG